MFRPNVSETLYLPRFGAAVKAGSPVKALRLMAAVLLLLVPAARSAYGQFSVLYTFTGGADGGFPAGDLIQDAAGNLYGTAGYGGVSAPRCHNSCGVVYEVAPSTSTETVLYDFVGITKGYYPDVGLIRDSHGNLYGTTDGGGDINVCLHGEGFGAGCGIVFRVDQTGNQFVLHRFTPATGSVPAGSLVGDAEGNLYGVTLYGGASNLGVIFRIDSSGNYTVLHSFAGPPNDGSSATTMFRDNAGNLYGTTGYGGTTNNGTVFKIDMDGTETILHNFTYADGTFPDSQLVEDASGNLYGATINGISGGVVFKLDAAANYSVLHTFSAVPDGLEPQGKLFLDEATGSLYGATEYGGSGQGICIGIGGCGAIFKVDSSGNETILYSFTGFADGSSPFTGVIGRLNGSSVSLFGTTPFGQYSGNSGTVYRLIVPQ